MTDLTPLEAHLLAFYAQGAARDFTAAPRFYPHGELVLIVEDKIQVAARRFGRKAVSGAKPVASAFVDHMIAAGAWSTKANDFGGTMHQFQDAAYKAALAGIAAADPIIAAATTADPDFWETTFTRLTS
jgi:hypothetical protein